MASISKHPNTEGYIDFDAPDAGKPCKTWYKIIGSPDSASPPLITLHGGPGAGHDYLGSLIDIYSQHNIPVIFYDQVGCARSTHFPEKLGDATFWTFELFYAELDNLIDHLELREKGFYLLGQSWGAILGAAYASRKPKGLKKLIISSGPASIPLYMKGVGDLLSRLPEDVQKTLKDCEEKGDYESPEYEAAAAVFYKRHAAFKYLKEDPTSYLTMQGPSEFKVIWTIKDWEGYQDAHNIEVGTLLIHGRYDEVGILSVTPWFKAIPKVKWVTLENSSHMTHWEDRERYMEICGAFLTS